MTAVRLGLAMLLVAIVLAACANLSSAPFSREQSCQAVGGTYTADGRCNNVGLP
jgi:hypothetical protein